MDRKISVPYDLKIIKDGNQILAWNSISKGANDEKSDKFVKLNQSSVDVTINPLREQMKEFKARVEFVYDKESKDRQSLLSEIGQLKNLNSQCIITI